MESVDLLFDRMNDINQAQQTLQKQVMAHNQKVDFISQQVQSNGQAVAQLTLKQFEAEENQLTDESVSIVYEEEAEDFQNVFAKGKTTMKAPGQDSPSNLRTNTTKIIFHITLFPKCSFLHLRAPTQRFGLITVKTTSQFIAYQQSSGSLQQLCTSRRMQLNGGKHINRLTRNSNGLIFVKQYIKNLALMISGQL